ncbi:putative membrane protein [Mycobacterium xenopi 4042]|uniref:Putative membrane protein n=1 Tax=Mycobacterium xenopi 4042 TaxID=1299334 RepID=X8BGC9_MYCXE|nr:putative membrane protein [Mycobacterium xenopi 4042]EUA44366.1 putative membrane protein [Mycobacterium xenopi 3993]
MGASTRCFFHAALFGYLSVVLYTAKMCFADVISCFPLL